MIKKLSPGKVFLDYGPITMVIAAWQKEKPLTNTCVDSCEVAINHLKETSQCLANVKKTWPLCHEKELVGSALLMWQAAKITEDENLTPMATVAGLMSDYVADWLVEQGATKVIINNGGDIALRLLGDEVTTVGVIPFLGATGFSRTLKVKGKDKIGGIATSGLGGRSFTQGIVGSVTVLAERSIVADAFATSLANKSFITSPRVKQVKAKTLDPNTDIPEHMVTIEVDDLLPEEIDKSLKQIKENANRAIKQGQIIGVIAYLQGKELIIINKTFLSDLTN